jgi:NitT/TauT family transport system permease protein
MPTAWWRGAVGVLVLFIVVEALTRAERVSPAYLPPASSIVAEAGRLVVTVEFWSALVATLWAALYGLLRAVVIAVPIGLLLGLSDRAYRAAITVVELFRPIPSVALVPLAILVLGRGTEMKVFLVTYACVWPILFNTIYGAHSVDRVSTDTATAFGLSRLRSARRVTLPAAAPFIFVGVKIATSIALILAVSAELVGGSPSGLGAEMFKAQQFGNLKLVYAYTLVTGVIGLVSYIGLEALDRRFFAWNQVERPA